MSEAVWTIETLLKALGSLVIESKNASLGNAGAFGPITTDSRKIKAGSIFIALKGEKFDGHTFALKAAQEGASILILERSVGARVPEIIVKSTTEAYGALANHWRRQFRIPVIAVVGSNGKTTTTQMIASILRSAVGEESLVATEGNFNNAVGVPMTLLRFSSKTKVAVVEAGMNHPGEMAQLVSWIAPTVVVVTNAQREHQEFLSTVEGSARENGLAIVALPKDGTAVLPRKDASLSIWMDLARARGCHVLTYAVGDSDARIRGKVQVTGDVTVETPRGGFTTSLQTMGLHAVHDALAATAATLDINVPLASIHEGLATFEPVAGRGKQYVLENGTRVIDDAYNANPDSMKTGIDVLASFAGPKILIAGEMGEIGEQSEKFHAEIGAYAKEKGITKFYATGEAMRAAVAAFGANAFFFEKFDDLMAKAMQEAQAPSTLLVKGSHYVGLTRIVKALTQKEE